MNAELVREFIQLARTIGFPADSLDRLLTPLVSAAPAQRLDVVGGWFERENLPFAPGTWADRESPLYNVPRFAAGEFAAAVARRDTLVYFSDTSNAALYELDAITQAVSVLYAPKFQTVELPFFSNYELAKSAGVGIPGSYVAYRRGVPVGHVVRPGRWENLVTEIGLA